MNTRQDLKSPRGYVEIKRRQGTFLLIRHHLPEACSHTTFMIIERCLTSELSYDRVIITLNVRNQGLLNMTVSRLRLCAQI
jgi:hypothetical protein